MEAIRTENLTKYYGKARGIIGLNLSVEMGECFGFIGPNGAGKSTTIRTILGLISPTSGKASVLGKDILTEKEAILRETGYLPSEALFYSGMKVKDIAEVLSGSQILLFTALSLMLTSVLLAVGAHFNKKNCSKSFKHMKGGSVESKGRESYTPLDSVCVGLTQVAAALLPGLSRSGSTLAVGEMRGINKQKALDFTFVLGIPSILAAALLEGVEAVKSPDGISVEPLVILVGVAVSAVVGYLSILLFKWFLKTDKMIILIIYTAIVGVALLVISAIEIYNGANLFTGEPAALFS